MTFLVAEDEGNLAVEPEPLNQVSVVLLSIDQFEDEHLDEDEGRIDGGEDALDGVLASIAILISVVGIGPHRFEHDSIRT